MNIFEQKLSDNKIVVDQVLSSFLVSERIGCGKLADAIEYCVLGGGKRIRAFLVREFSRMYDGSEEAALQFAIAMELGHAASLVHDDMPCMDDGKIRHGKPACHIMYGEDIALLVGDALLTLAFEVSSDNPYISAEVSRHVTKLLAASAGARGMCHGQVLDLEKTSSSFEELLHLYDLKTGLSLETSCILGYLSVDRLPEEKVLSMITNYAKILGRIFQISDDLLDMSGNSFITGKDSGIDQRNGTKTILSYMSYLEAREYMNNLAHEASQIFDNMTLRELPLYLAKREK